MEHFLQKRSHRKMSFIPMSLGFLRGYGIISSMLVGSFPHLFLTSEALKSTSGFYTFWYGQQNFEIYTLPCAKLQPIETQDPCLDGGYFVHELRRWPQCVFDQTPTGIYHHSIKPETVAIILYCIVLGFYTQRNISIYYRT